MTRSPSQRLLLAFGLFTLWRTSVAQQTGDAGFQWKWSNNMISTQLTQCESYGIDVISLANNESAFGTPPYYMIAWRESGIPTVSYIGTDRNNLSWTVNQPSDSRLLLTVADSEELSGGEAASVYTVASGSGDTSCLPPPPSTNFTLAANISTSDPLETCQPLGLRVYGGQEPYTISLQAVGSPVVTNVTLDDGNDVLTWPNLADPNGEIMASVSDANGTWGTSTGLFKTTGDAVTNNTRCSVVTNQGNSANIDQNPPPPSKSNTTAIVVGVVVPVVVIGLLAVLGFFLWRRRQKEKSREAEPAFLPDAWVGPSFADAGSDGGAPFSPYDPPASAKMARYRDDVNSHSHTPSGGQGGIAMGNLPAGSASSPRHAATHSGGASAAGSRSNEGHFGGGKGGPRLPPGVSPDWAVEPDIIIQHRDGGAVQEIPPPYPSFVAQPEPSHVPPTSSPPAPGPSLPGGLAVADSSFAGSSRPSSAGGPSSGSGSSAAPLISPPAPTPYKGKGRETTDLIS